MKNVSLTVSNNSYMAPAQIPAPPAAPGFPAPSKVFIVSFSAQFDEEAAAIKFAAELLNKVSGE